MKDLKGKIILVDNEDYEKQLLEIAIEKQKWNVKVEFFNNVDKAIQHLKDTEDEIFLIISDMEMPEKSGMEFKRIIEEDKYLSQKSIPFIFMSSFISREIVIEAYQYRVQGFFRKAMTPDDQAAVLETIVQYWKICAHPRKIDLPSTPY